MLTNDYYVIISHQVSSLLVVVVFVMGLMGSTRDNVPHIKIVFLWVIQQLLLLSSISMSDIDMKIFSLTWLNIGVIRLAVIVSCAFSPSHPPHELHREQSQSLRQKLWDFSIGLIQSCSSLVLAQIACSKRSQLPCGENIQSALQRGLYGEKVRLQPHWGLLPTVMWVNHLGRKSSSPSQTFQWLQPQLISWF